MKTELCTILACLLLALSASPVAIVVPDRETPLVFPPGKTVRYAAEFLKKYLESSAGGTFTIVPESRAPETGARIFVGDTSFARSRNVSPEKLEPETLRILSAGSSLILCGEISPEGLDRGTLFAVYEYLERAMGIRWFYPDDPAFDSGVSGTVIPHRNSIPLSDWNVCERPRFRMREGGVSHPFMSLEKQKLWHPVLRFGNTTGREYPNHTQIAWSRLYWKTHPEYFAAGADGKPHINERLPHRSYLCPSEPGVLRQMVKNLDSWDRTRTPADAWGPRTPDRTRVCFAFNDGLIPANACQCPRCRALFRPERPYEGVGSEWAFTFVKKYAESIQARWPGRRLLTLAYQFYQAPPETVSVPGNVDIVYVTKRVQYSSSPAEFAHEKAKLRRWSELLGNDRSRFGLWFNIVDPVRYTSKVPFLYPNLFREWLLEGEKYTDSCFVNGLNPERKGLSEEGRLDAASTYPMVWIQAKLLWNPDRTSEALFEDYAQSLFGPAAKTMRAFFEAAAGRWEADLPQPEGMSELEFIHTVRFGESQTAELRRLLDHALSECAPGSAEFRRIEFLKDRVYSRFFEESRQYHAGRISKAGTKAPEGI